MNAAALVRRAGAIWGVSHALRKLSRAYREGSVVTIRTGRLSGLKWRRFHRYVNGYWIGHYELDMQDVFAAHVKPGDTVFDVGCNAGFFSLLSARLAGPGGKCVAFDPDPANIQSVSDQFKLNGYDRSVAVLAAVADKAGTARFVADEPGSAFGRLSFDPAEPGGQTVEVLTLDDAAQRYGMPAVVKVDVEGAEGHVLAGAPNVLAARRAAWLVEVHNPEVGKTVRDVFDRSGYRLELLDGASSITDFTGPPVHVLAHPKDAG